MPAPLLQLKDIALTFGGTPLLDLGRTVGGGRRTRLPGREERLRQIDAAQDRGRRGRARQRLGVRAARRVAALSGAGTGLRRRAVGAGLCRGRPRPERRGLSGAADARRARASAATRIRRGCPAARRGARRWRACWRPNPDILLLDEPTNHLDLPTIEWLERELEGRRSAIVMISHDRRFLSNMSRSTVWLDRGRTKRVERGFADFEDWRDEVLAEEERDQHKLDRKIVAEEHWLRYGVTARRKRNVKRLATLADPARNPAHASRRHRQRHDRGERGGAVRRAGDRGEGHRQELRGPRHRRELLHPRAARRPHRHRRPERQRQDHAGRHADRRA